MHCAVLLHINLAFQEPPMRFSRTLIRPLAFQPQCKPAFTRPQSIPREPYGGRYNSAASYIRPTPQLLYQCMQMYIMVTTHLIVVPVTALLWRRNTRLIANNDAVHLQHTNSRLCCQLDSPVL